MKRSRALISVALGALCFGTLAILTQMAYKVGIKPLPLLAWRFFLAALIIGFFAYQRNHDAFKVPKRDIVRYCMLSWFGYGASSLTFFFALMHADSSVVSALLYAYPALVAIGATFIFKEPFNKQKAVSIAVVALGSVFVVGLFGGGKVHVDTLGIVLAIASAVCYAAFNIMSQKWLPGRSSMTMMSFTFAFSALAFIVLTSIVNGPHALFAAADWSLRAWTIMIIIVIFPTVVAILLYMRGVRQLGASEAAIVSTFEPLFTVIFAWIMLGQRLTFIQFIGVLLILIGVVLSAFAKKSASPIPVVPLSDDEIAQRREDWVGPNGETMPEYAKRKIGFLNIFASRKKPHKDLSPEDERNKKILTIGLIIVVALIVIQIFALVGIAALVSMKAPDITLKNIADHSSQTSIFYAADGTEIARFVGDEERVPVAISKIPQTVTDATVAIEDKRFYEHGGVDIISIMRALKRNTEEGVIKQGGSTITQQLVKMLYTDGERTLARKLREAVLATRVEMSYPKNEVLESYLNMAYYGQGAYGIESAARTYFNTTVENLTLEQSAMLAGLVRSPGAYDAFDDPAPVKARRDMVLEAMYQQGKISQSQYKTAVSHELGVVRSEGKKDVVTYPYFVDYARRQVIAQIGEEAFNRGGFKVYTTLDPALQQQADATAQTFSKSNEPEVSIVSVRKNTGEVLAMVGGRDWSHNQFNLAVQGKRQPGSAFKPFTLMTALEKGVSLQATYDSSPYETKVKDEMWHVSNYDDGPGSGRMSVEAATIWSVNTVYARLVMQVGPQNVASLAKKFGFSSQIDGDPAICLGGLKYGVSPLEMAGAYAAIANDGKFVAPTPLVRIVDRHDKVVYTAKAHPQRVVSAKTARTTAGVLHEVVEIGTGASSKIGCYSAGKTGTTQSYRDAWFCGWANGVSTAVWMGYPQAQVEMKNVRGKSVTGGSYPAQLWSRYMSAAIALRPKTGCTIEAQPVQQPVQAPTNQETNQPNNLDIPVLDESGNVYTGGQ